MAAKMTICAILALVVAAAALAGEASPLKDYDMYKLCRRVDEQLVYAPASWATPISAYESAMKYVMNLGGLFSLRRMRLALAWRAVTYDEACLPSSLAYVHEISACQPSTRPSMKFLDEDTRKYAQKCITPELLERKVAKLAGAPLEEFLTDELLVAYRRANPKEPAFHFGSYVLVDSCCKPERSVTVLSEMIARDFPQEVEKFRIGGSSRNVERFLLQHLYKPCESYVKRMDRMMDQIDAASFYAFGGKMNDMPQNVQGAVFRFNICSKLEYDWRRAELTGQVANYFGALEH